MRRRLAKGWELVVERLRGWGFLPWRVKVSPALRPLGPSALASPEQDKFPGLHDATSTTNPSFRARDIRNYHVLHLSGEDTELMPRRLLAGGGGVADQPDPLDAAQSAARLHT
jgi:hypothetical protein